MGIIRCLIPPGLSDISSRSSANSATEECMWCSLEVLPPHFTYSQLFGEPDADQDVSPDTADPELQDNSTAENDSSSDQQQMEEEERRLSTRQWAESIAYDPEQLFTKLFYEDIVYLLRMDKLWLKRSPPAPLRLDHLPEVGGAVRGEDEEGLQDQRLWSVKECVQVFMQRCGGIESEVFIALQC